MKTTPTLPSGTVTFLFTDIEGSTRLLQHLGDEYAALLSEHRAILRAAFAQHGGQEVDAQGDAFFVSFSRARDALEAVVKAQCALAAHAESQGVDMRVRMGLHTGEPLVGEEGYVGIDVHRAARIAHVGHGGQVLLSESVVALVRNQLPKDVGLRPLGEHRLKDLSSPEPLFQLLIPGLLADFPPLNTLDSQPNNLPVQLTSFVGRTEEISEVKNLLNEARLVTLMGPGGTGKTRLSLQVAADMVDTFAHGVWFVELEPVESPADLIPAVASALQFSIDGHSSDLDPKRQLLDYLGQRSMLLVMDNFEHLVEGADLLTEILTGSPEARLMITSRERLNLREEWVYPVSGMGFPTNGNGAGVEAYNSLTLFLERGRQVIPDFKLIGEDLTAVIRICQLVEGMPLGIELAASWVGILPCREIVAEIEGNMDFLATSMRGIPAKHRSLRAIFDQSWRLLNETQQSGFRKLAVFQGGFRRKAAAVVAGVTLPMLTEFAQKSLLRPDERGRFEMHALLKAFTTEKLNDNPDEAAAVSAAHSRYFVDFLGELSGELQGESMLELREVMRAESGNVRAALRWAITHWDAAQARAALQSFGIYAQTEGFHAAQEFYRRLALYLRDLGAGLEPAAPYRTVLLAILASQAANDATVGDPETEALLDTILPVLRELDLPFELGVALLSRGIILEYQAEFPQAIECLEESLALLEGFQYHFMAAAVQSWLGWAHYELGEYDRAGTYFQEMYEDCMETRNILGLPYALSKLGTWSDALQKYEKGLGYHQEAQGYFKAIGDQAGQGYALSRMALSAWGMKSYEQALEYGRAGFEQFQAIGHRWGIATSLGRIGYAEQALGQLEQARVHFYEGLERALEYGYPSTVNYALIGLACLSADVGDEERAVEILTLALEHPSTPGLYRDIGRRALADLEAVLAPDLFAETQEMARARDYEAVLADIRRESTVQ
jgi:predicted ATPase/class 3 adenylate cyclase